MSNRPARLTLFGMLVLVLSSCAPASFVGTPTAIETATATATATASHPEWLFVVQSTGDSTFDAATTILSIPADSVHGFTDRPFRETRTLQPSDFIDFWSSTAPDSFAADPPNAALTFWQGDAGSVTPTTVVCEIVGGLAYSSSTRMMSMRIRPITPDGLFLPARLERASLFIDDLTTCTNSPDDEAIVEYTNMQIFEGTFEITTTASATGGTFLTTITCPERESSTVPPSDMDVVISTADRSQTSSCYHGGAVKLTRDQTSTLPYCNASADCTLVVSVINSDTNTTYSQTMVRVPVTTVGSMVPELNMATLPLCPNGQ